MLTPEEIQKIRSDAGVAPLESQQSQGQSLSERLGISTKGVPLTSKLGFVESVKQDLAERVEGVEEAADKYQTGEIGLASGALQVAGEAAGGLADIFMRALSKATPDIIERPIVEGVEDVIKGAAESDIGKDVAQRIADWSSQHPEASKNLEAVVNLLSVLPAGKAAQIGGKLFQKVADPVIKATGTAFKKQAARVLSERISVYVRDLVRPQQIKKVREGQVPRTTEIGSGPFKRSVIEPSVTEATMEKYVVKVPGISDKNTIQGSYSVIQKEVGKEAERLIKDLKANDFTYTKKELLKRFDAVKNDLRRNPSLVGDAEKVANKLIAEIERRIDSSTGKAVAKISKELEPLAKEARKFNNVEEFVDSQKKVFHGTSTKNVQNIESRGFNLDTAGERGGGFAKLGEGIYFRSTKEGVREFGDGTVEAFILADTKILDVNKRFKDLPDLFLQSGEAGFGVNRKGISDFIKSLGFDGAKLGDDIVIYDLSTIKTKSQLTDLFNQAKGVSGKESLGLGSNLLQIRKDFDDWVREQKGSSVFDPTKESGFTTANRDIRTTINAFIDEKAPSANVKESLAKQTALYKAMDTIVPKAALEADTALRRALDVWTKIIGIKSRGIQILAAAYGIGGLGAAATFAGPVALAGVPAFLTWRLGKLALSPEVRKALGTVLLEVEKKQVANISGRAIGGVTPTVLKEIQEDVRKILEEY
jgi:hypothetical protein